jgi:hypothetical protein
MIISLMEYILSSMALQPFVGPWSLLQLRKLFYTDGRTPWTSDQFVTRPLPTQQYQHKQRKFAYTNIHALTGIRTHYSSFRASLRPRTVTLRVVGGDEKGSVTYETVKYGQGLGPKKHCAVEGQ